VFPQNKHEDAQKVIKAFGWNADELLGNMTLEEMLVKEVDLRSLPVKLEKLVQEHAQRKIE